MLTYYCPNCWAIVTKEQKSCLNCGFLLEDYQHSNFEDKLLAALHHSLPDRRIMAAQILGNLQSHRALPEFYKIITGPEMDYFFLRAVILAAAKIDHPQRTVLLKLAVQDPSELISKLAKEKLDELKQEKENEKWDRHPG